MLLGCTGAVGEPVVGATNPAPGTSPPTERAFDVRGDSMVLLPFVARWRRLAAVAGVAMDDPALGAVVSHRLELGDHDYGQNVAPDLTWSSKRMTAWILAIGPLCDDSRMKARYADWK